MPFTKRVSKLQKTIKTSPCDAFLVEDATNLFYLTGQHFSAGTLIVSTNHADLVVDSRYFELAQKNCPVAVHKLEETTLNKLLKARRVSLLGFAKDKVSYGRYEILTERLPKISIVPLDDPVLTLRSIKDADEIQLLRKSAELGSKGFDFLLTELKVGVTEKELSLKLSNYWRSQGGKGPGFDPIIAFGANSSMPHYRSGDTKLKKGDIVLIDIGVILNDYHSDMTRSVFFGKPKATLKEIYQIVLEAQEKALSLCRPGVLAGVPDRAARDLITDAGYGEFFCHGLGHGIGLDIHELPVLKNKAPYDQVNLKKGVVVTVEPGIYLPGIGGVRIEDSIVVNSSGFENLSRVSKELTVV